MHHKPNEVLGVGATICGLLASALPGLATGAPPVPNDEFRPYASAGIGHDSNVFRVDDEVQPIADRSDDGFWTAEAGLDARLTRGNQQYALHGLAYHNDYDELDEVDFTGGTAELTWDWAVGRLWSGALEYEFRRELRDFANQRVPRVDPKTSNLFSGSVERRLSERSRFGVRAAFADIEFSQADQLGLRRTGFGASFARDSLAGNTVSLDADYTNRESDESGGTDFTEFLAGPAVDWRLTDKSRIQARLRYTQRDEDDPALRDYSGLTGRITGHWRSATRNTVTVAAWHELSNLGDEIANFALVTGVNVRSTVSIGSRVSVKLGLGYESRDFERDLERDVLPDPDLPLRDDDVLTADLGVEWSVADRVKLLFDYDTQYRDSTRVAQDYDYHRVQMRVRVGL